MHPHEDIWVTLTLFSPLLIVVLMILVVGALA